MKLHVLFIFFFLVLTTQLISQKENLVEINNISIDTMGDIKWNTNYKDGIDEISIVIEHFKNNKWVAVNNYCINNTIKKSSQNAIKWITSSCLIKDSVRIKFRKGENKFRICVTSPILFTSNEVTLISKTTNSDGNLWISGSKIILDYIIEYEILDVEGKLIKKGYEKEIDISVIKKGTHFLYTKQWTKEFKKD